MSMLMLKGTGDDSGAIVRRLGASTLLNTILISPTGGTLNTMESGLNFTELSFSFTSSGRASILSAKIVGFDRRLKTCS